MDMRDIFDILVRNIREDSISMVFTFIILVFFFIGAVPGLVLIASRMLDKMPVMGRVSKNPFILIGLGIIGIISGIYVGLHSWVFSLIVVVFFSIIIAPRLNKLPVVNTLSVNPSLLTTMGILGTFVGIYIGLHKFNITNIDRSIPDLLMGLKIAFTTSIVGIIAAILLKIVQSVQIPSEKETKKGVPDIFENINMNLTNHLKQSQVQHQQILDKTQDNVDIQSKIFQLLHLKMDSLEDSIRKLTGNFQGSLNQMMKDTSSDSDSLNE